jgi:hypothetical protein
MSRQDEVPCRAKPPALTKIYKTERLSTRQRPTTYPLTSGNVNPLPSLTRDLASLTRPPEARTPQPCAFTRCRCPCLRANLIITNEEEVSEMEWTPEAINAEIAYRRGDLVAKQHVREFRQGQPPRWWRRSKPHRPDDGNGERRAA